jgi:hypothetical protein
MGLKKLCQAARVAQRVVHGVEQRQIAQLGTAVKKAPRPRVVLKIGRPRALGRRRPWRQAALPSTVELQGEAHLLVLAAMKQMGLEAVFRAIAHTCACVRASVVIISAGSLRHILPTSAAGRATLYLFAEGRTLALEEFKYAFESWREPPAIAGGALSQLSHFNA